MEMLFNFTIETAVYKEGIRRLSRKHYLQTGPTEFRTHTVEVALTPAKATVLVNSKLSLNNLTGNHVIVKLKWIATFWKEAQIFLPMDGPIITLWTRHASVPTFLPYSAQVDKIKLTLLYTAHGSMIHGSHVQDIYLLSRFKIYC